MFQLVVTVFGLALSVSAGIASLVYITPVYNQAVERIHLSRDLNEAAQLSAGMMLLRFESGGAAPADADAFNLLQAHGYVSSIPSGWQIASGQLFKPLPSVAECISLNQIAGQSFEDAAVASCAPCDIAKNTPACLSQSGPIFRAL